ncbi:glycosyltransferase [Streptomyces sp. Ru73]|uniref:glycosyltransferase n=1 Tax=Streptomyces sp. Ru73 TaxID=2080748 RepID=UPI000CDD19A9|nr:glycosyltransferase [Streptomyces sp. Ru73]POX41284.1 glycosyltransferase [Streptomyces sp. Ru73]
MKLLISTLPATGHVNPALPLAARLVERGHEVLWHTGEAYAPQVKATGARFVPYDQAADLRRLPAEPDPGTKGMAAGVSALRKLLIDRMPGQLADYEAILADFPADLLVTDMCAVGAATLRDKGGPAYATLGINPLVTTDPEIPPFTSSRPPATSFVAQLPNRLAHFLTRRVLDPKLRAALDTHRAGLGLPPFPRDRLALDITRSPYLHLMPTTEAFEFPRRRMAPHIHFVGPLLPDPPAAFDAPEWWDELAAHEGRVVHVTQGTVATDPTALLRPAVEALAEEDVLVVATGPDPAGTLGALPDNVRWAPFIPHARLLPHVSVMITNAGYNGVLTALAHGVPLICAGRTEDKTAVSARVAWSGAGLDLRTDRPDAPTLRRAVRTVLTTPSYRAAATRLRTDFATHDAPTEASELLEELATRTG